jgi:hypothetical protein
MGIVFMITGIRMIIGGPMEYIEQRDQVDWPEIRAEIVDVSSRVESSGTGKHRTSTTYYDFIIEYKVNGKTYTTVEQPTKGWESQFLQKVLNRIESLVNAGAVVTGLTEIK